MTTLTDRLSSHDCTLLNEFLWDVAKYVTLVRGCVTGEWSNPSYVLKLHDILITRAGLVTLTQARQKALSDWRISTIGMRWGLASARDFVSQIRTDSMDMHMHHIIAHSLLWDCQADHLVPVVEALKNSRNFDFPVDEWGVWECEGEALGEKEACLKGMGWMS